jgi:hypothetical protein
MTFCAKFSKVSLFSLRMEKSGAGMVSTTSEDQILFLDMQWTAVEGLPSLSPQRMCPIIPCLMQALVAAGKVVV